MLTSIEGTDKHKDWNVVVAGKVDGQMIAVTSITMEQLVLAVVLPRLSVAKSGAPTASFGRGFHLGKEP